MKYCKKCDTKKPLNSFRVNRAKPDGLCIYCRTCMTADKQAWYTKNYYPGSPYQKRVSEKGKWVRKEQPDIYAKWQTASRIRNRAAILEGKKRYREQNRELNRFWQLRYKHLKRNAVGTYTRQQLKDRIAYYNSKCYICFAPYEEIDHVIPLSRGGTNWPSNLRPICSPCNKVKGNKIPV